MNTRWGEPVEGEMEIVEFEPERTIATVIHDANMDMGGRATLEALDPGRTLLTVTAHIAGLEDPEKVEFLRSMMQRSVDNVKRLIESETDSGETWRRGSPAASCLPPMTLDTLTVPSRKEAPPR